MGEGIKNGKLNVHLKEDKWEEMVKGKWYRKIIVCKSCHRTEAILEVYFDYHRNLWTYTIQELSLQGTAGSEFQAKQRATKIARQELRLP